LDFAQMYQRTTNVELCTSAPILPNPCWWLVFFCLYYFFKTFC
jgi:hypothetical protein